MNQTRPLWLSAMLRICSPVYNALAAGALKAQLPTQFHPERAPFAPLEAFGRSFCGMAPWLALDGLTGQEGALQQRYRTMVLQSIGNATNPDSPDFMNWGEEGKQPLVDAAFVAHGLLRSGVAIVPQLTPQVKGRLIACLKRTRDITPGQNNWLLFSAMVEGALYLLGEEDCRISCVEHGVNQFMAWYQGDGSYGDGPHYRWDFYNSFVIHPMLVDLVQLFDQFAPLRGLVLRRAARYAEVLERMIGQDGTYPPIGRSLVYRFGAFQLLSQAALQGFLPPDIAPAQVRCALTQTIQATLASPSTFDAEGWLTPGLAGHQPGLAEGYINTGSLYLATTAFLPLGLSDHHPFWSQPDQPWTARKAWGGTDLPADHALGE